MKRLHLAAAAATLAASLGAHAQVTGSTGGGVGTFVTLSSAGLAGGSVATLTGGTVYMLDMPFADRPSLTIAGNAFLAAGASSGTVATLNFTTGVSYLSFLWGSPDSYNLLTVTTANGVQSQFTTSSLGIGTSNGDQTFSEYVQFSAAASNPITKLSFTNTQLTDAFESANYVVVAAVPEPQTYALIAAGLGAVVFMARRRG